MPTDFRHSWVASIAVMQRFDAPASMLSVLRAFGEGRCARPAFLNRRARGSTVATHHSWKLNRTAERSETASLTSFQNNAGNRAGTVSKTDRSALRNGEHALRLPPLFSPAWMDKKSHRFCKAEDAGALPAAGSTSNCPVM